MIRVWSDMSLPSGDRSGVGILGVASSNCSLLLLGLRELRARTLPIAVRCLEKPNSPACVPFEFKASAVAILRDADVDAVVIFRSQEVSARGKTGSFL